MTPDDTFDRALSVWLDADASRRVPAHLDEVLTVTAATRQRPWWSSPERWLPMDLTMRPPLLRVPFRTRALVLTAIAALIVAALIALAAGGDRRLPPPFGLARNGIWNTALDGDLYRLDPATGQRTALLTDPAYDFGGTFSRDGTKFMFLRSANQPGAGPAFLRLGVANADGTGVRLLTPLLTGLDWMDWSPDGTQIAYIAQADGVEGTLHVANVDGSGVRRLETIRPMHFPTWLPPAGREIVYTTRFEDGVAMPEVWGIRPDGSGEHRISRRTGASAGDYQDLAASPDGRTLGFTHWSSAFVASVRLIDVTTGEERTLPAPSHQQQRVVVFSPDGTLVAYQRMLPDFAIRMVVARADGTDTGIELGPVWPGAGGWYPDASAAFTPDGKSIIVNYGRDEGGLMLLLPIDGGAPTTLAEGEFGFVDVQRRAP